VLTRPGRLPDRHPPLHSGQSLNPATPSHHARLRFTRHQQGFTHVHPSGLPLATAPGMEPAALRLPLELRTPPSPAAHVEGGDRPSSTDLELPLNSHPSISNPVVHSMRATARRTANRRSLAAIADRSPAGSERLWVGAPPAACAYTRSSDSGTVGPTVTTTDRSRRGRVSQVANTVVHDPPGARHLLRCGHDARLRCRPAARLCRCRR